MTSSTSWVRQSNLSWYHKLLINILKAGPIPHHVAFIMDGNRRYANKEKIDKAEGHSKGFDKLSETLQWCLDIGIGEVTVYAFSIENFNRSKEEVDTLMSLAREKFARLLEERDKLHERGICIRIIGNLKLLPEDIQKTTAEAMLLTKDNKTAILNVCFAYTSRDEITSSIKTIAEGVTNKEIKRCDVTEELITECLYTRECTDPDLLVRTSGELRFSDFMLWQSSSTVVYFTKTLWPEFSIWHLLGAVFYYQRCYCQMQIVKQSFENSKIKPEAEDVNQDVRIKQFLKNLDNSRHESMLKCASLYLK